MNFLKRLNIISLIVILIPIHALAALSLELTQGINRAIPIAILPFNTMGGTADVYNNPATIIQNDLRNSGRFAVNPVTGLSTYPDSVEQVDFTQWQKAHVDNVVIGQVKPTAGGKYQVTVSLLDAFGAAKKPEDHIVFSKRYDVSAGELRGLAHHISDLIYQQLTGERGIFSTKIAYIYVQNQGQPNATYRLMVADVDGFNPRPILTSTEPIMSPAWSPDGNQIAYVSFENKRAHIFISNIYNGQRKMVSSYDGINGAPAFSPDGTQLALVLSKDDNPHIYIMDLATKSIRQLTFGTSIDTEPNWAPDGNSIIFTSDRSGGPQIYQVILANRDVQRITFDGTYNARASFAPDGKHMAFLHMIGRNSFEISWMDLVTGELQTLTNTGLNESPSIAPNGKMILYGENMYSKTVLGIVSTDGNIKLNLPDRDGVVRDPAWSPYLS